MDRTMLHALTDELAKMSAALNAAAASTPAPVRVPSFKNVTKADAVTKSQGYSNVNTETPMAAMDTASGTKTVPPPPVQT